MAASDDKKSDWFQSLLIVVIGQVGCLTLLVVLGSALLGIWLDGQLGTRPYITLMLLVAGIPLSVLLMIRASRRALSRMAPESAKHEKDLK